MTDAEYDEIEEKAASGESITLAQAVETIHYIRDRGITRFGGMTKDSWIETVLELLGAAGVDV